MSDDLRSSTSNYEKLSLHINIDCGFGVFSKNLMDLTYASSFAQSI